MKYPLLTLALTGLLLSCPVYGQKNSDFPTEALRGLSTLGLRVEFDGNPERTAGLTAEQLRSEILLRLNLGGLKVLDGQEWQKGKGDPYLYLNVHSIPVAEHGGTIESYCYAFSLDLMEKVHLARIPRVFAEACTWSEGYSVIVPRNDLRRVTEKVGDLAADFVKAVETANQIREPEVRAVP
jgi:hypothetical protein